MPKKINKEMRMEEICMQLVHYFITRENYQPVVVNGVNHEIWLENSERKYQIIRINYNYIHNNEQLEFDVFKTKSILKQIKKKTMSFKTNALTILLNAGDNVNIKNQDKLVKVEVIDDLNNIYKNNNLLTIFPELENDYIESGESTDPYINLALDINKKTDERNQLFEKTFKKRKPILSYGLIGLFIILFSLMNILYKPDNFILNTSLIQNGEWYRFITNMFVSKDIIVLLVVCYSLLNLGSDIETTYGHIKSIIIMLGGYLISNLMMIALYKESVFSTSFIGGIAGILGGLLYLGYYYRPYFAIIFKTKIMPIIFILICLSFVTKEINIITLLGGVIGGLFTSMIVGVKGRSEKNDTFNGIVVSLLLISVLLFMIFN